LRTAIKVAELPFAAGNCRKFARSVADTVTNAEQGSKQMTAIDRRALLRDILPGAIVVAAGVTTIGFAFRPNVTQAMPLTGDTPNAPKIDTLAGKTQAMDFGSRHRRGHWHGHRRRRHRRWVCWWHRGRRVCGWRWW
jgi:hypothetical protein